tara:strand:+ start:401 stop:577 length:177 start_codon:yes stop_codon:yes gene_type:complete
MTDINALRAKFNALPKNIGDLSDDDVIRDLETTLKIHEQAMKEKAVLDAEIKRRKALK